MEGTLKVAVILSTLFGHNVIAMAIQPALSK
jgi:hypothetical protein